MDTTTQPAPLRKKKNQLTHDRVYIAGDWVRDADLSKTYTYAEMQRQASRDVGFTVSLGSLQSAMAHQKKTLAVKPSKPQEVAPSDMVTLVNELHDFMTNPAFHQPTAAFTALRFKLTPQPQQATI